MSVQKDFRTKDLYFAAYLKAIGIPFLKSAKVGRKTYFVFENPDNMRDLRNDYFRGAAEVPALAFSNEIKNLKTLCHMN